MNAADGENRTRCKKLLLFFTRGIIIDIKGHVCAVPKEELMFKNCFLRAIALLLMFILLTLPIGCSRSAPPALEEIYDDAVSLIEQSHAVNDLVFGFGLPTWEMDSDYADLQNLYPTATSYEYVTNYTPYRTTLDIKQAMQAVNSTDYLESLNVTLFDGYAYEEGIMAAQFREDSQHLYQHKTYEPLVTWQRIYDYSTMRVVDGDAQTAVIELETHLENSTEVLVVQLVLVLEEDGWRLDTPTY